MKKYTDTEILDLISKICDDWLFKSDKDKQQFQRIINNIVDSREWNNPEYCMDELMKVYREDIWRMKNENIINRTKYE